MSDIDPEDVFKRWSEESLNSLAEKVNVHVRSKKRSKSVDKENLTEALINNVIKEGTTKLLSVIKVMELKKLVDNKDFKLEDKWTPPLPKSPKKGEKEKVKKGKPYPSKSIMIQLLTDFIEAKGWKDFLELYNREDLLAVTQDIDDLSDYDDDELKNISKKELVKAILTNVNAFGLNHHLHLLSIEELRAVCVSMELDVESASKEVLVESIIDRKDFKKSKKKVLAPSSKKPDIKKGITKVDLKNWYNRDEIEKWLKEKKEEDESLKDLKISGKKNALIDRMLKILEGDIEGATKKKKKRGRSKSKSRSGEEVSTEEKDPKKRKKNTED